MHELTEELRRRRVGDRRTFGDQHPECAGSLGKPPLDLGRQFSCRLAELVGLPSLRKSAETGRRLAHRIIDRRPQDVGVVRPVGVAGQLLAVERDDGDPVQVTELIELLPEALEDGVAVAFQGEDVVDEDQVAKGDPVTRRRSRRRRSGGAGPCFGGASAYFREELRVHFAAVHRDAEVVGLQSVDQLAAAVGDDDFEVDDAHLDALGDGDVGRRGLRPQGQSARQEETRHQEEHEGEAFPLHQGGRRNCGLERETRSLHGASHPLR